MKTILGIVLLLSLLSSCSKKGMVSISGRVENGDSVVSFWVNDSVYAFPLDETNSFSGKIPLSTNTYATLLPYSLNVYLSPGEDLEIYLNALNVSGSLYFRGSIGGVNTYLKEQEVAVFFDKDYYTLNETTFVKKMEALINEKTELLEAKNFDKSFTELEKQRIRYSVAERVAFYPIYQKRLNPEYRPAKVFNDFLSSFAINNKDLFGTTDYRKFLLNYVYYQGSNSYGTGEGYSAGIADYILSTINNPGIKDFLLTEIIYRHIWENNGLVGAEYLLAVFRRECSDPSKLAYIEELVQHWSTLLPGKPAPDFALTGLDGKKIQLGDFRGSYLYLVVWATWCVPCKSELPYLNLLEREYAGKKINILTVDIEGNADSARWSSFLEKNKYAGIHTIVGDDNKFNEKYMIVSVPRFILIGPDGTIVNSNAPRPSGPIRQLFDELNL